MRKKKIVIWPEVQALDAMVAIEAFERDHYDRVEAGQGVRDLCIYEISGRGGHFVYATATSIVVRRDATMDETPIQPVAKLRTPKDEED